MTIVLGAVTGAVFAALVATLLAWRLTSRRLAEEGARAAEAEGSVQRAVESAEKLSNDLADQRRRGADAEVRVTEAEVRISEAEGRVTEAEQRAVAAEARVAGAESELALLRTGGPPGMSAEVERVRLEREWQEVAGPGVPFPVAWDGSLRAAVTIELEIIREVTGTPSRLELGGVELAEAAGDRGFSGGGGWVLAGLGCELLRVVARHADEMVVKLEDPPDGQLGVTAEAIGATVPGDLSSIEEAAKGTGLTLTVEQTADGFTVRLSPEG